MRDFLEQTIREAGQIALSAYTSDIGSEQKTGRFDVVTEADKAVNAFIIEKIQAAYPDHKIVSEEDNDVVPKSYEYDWLIDPIDGTYNYAHGIGAWGVLMALRKQGKTIMAAAYLPATDVLYIGEIGKGVTKNGRKITVGTQETLDNAMGYCSRARIKKTILGKTKDDITLCQQALIRVVEHPSIKIMCYNAAITLSLIAEGAMDFAFVHFGMAWDLATPLFLCQEAGAIVTKLDGSDWTEKDVGPVVIANPTLHKEVMTLFA